jgi:hypothetical protein
MQGPIPVTPVTGGDGSCRDESGRDEAGGDEAGRDEAGGNKAGEDGNEADGDAETKTRGGATGCWRPEAGSR